MKKRRMLPIIVIGTVLLTICTGCEAEKKSPFFTIIETKYDEQDAEAVLENFREFVQNTDFTKFDYAYHQGEHKYQEEYVTEIDAYRNIYNTVFYADAKEAKYYYNEEEGILHCDTKGNEEASDLEGKEMGWTDFPFDTEMKKAYHMLSYLCDSKDYLHLEYERKALSQWNYLNRLSMDYWDRYNEGLEEWDNQTPEWIEQFGECGPYSISVFCNDDGTRFNSISMVWYEGALRYTVTWNSHEQILQSERCVIRYEYDHGLREDNVPAIEEQREWLKKELGDEPLYE